MSERDVIAIKVLDAKLSATTLLIIQLVIYFCVSFYKFIVLPFHIINPRIDIPHFLNNLVVKSDEFLALDLPEHCPTAILMEDEKGWGFASETIAREGQSISVVVRGSRYVCDQEYWCA